MRYRCVATGIEQGSRGARVTFTHRGRSRAISDYFQDLRSRATDLRRIIEE